MVATRHSRAASTAPPAASAALAELAKRDAREAERLRTNAHLDAEKPVPRAMGTYTYKGITYDIDEYTKPEWLEAAAKELKKKEEEAEKRRRRSEALSALNNSKKRKIEAVDSAVAPPPPPPAPPSQRKQSAPPSTIRRRSEPLKSATPAASRRRSEKAPASRKRENESDSTASSNIEVARPAYRTTTKSRPNARAANIPEAAEDEEESELSASESDSTDIPLNNFRGKTNITSNTSNKRAKSTNTGKGKTKATTRIAAPPLPPPPRRTKIDTSALAEDLGKLAKVNDRLAHLKKWWDEEKTTGAFQRLVGLAAKSREEQLAFNETEDLLEFAESVGSNETMTHWLQDTIEVMNVEEEAARASQELEDHYNVDENMLQEDAAAAYDENMPTPISEDPPSGASQSNIPAAVPTPPASDNEGDTTMQDADGRQPTPPASDDLSPRVMIPSVLPTHNKAGNPLRWSNLDIQKLNNIKNQLKTKEMKDPERAEYGIHMQRMEGESVAAKRRRVKREIREVDNWVGWTVIPEKKAATVEETQEMLGEMDMDREVVEEVEVEVPKKKLGRIGRGASRRRRTTRT